MIRAQIQVSPGTRRKDIPISSTQLNAALKTFYERIHSEKEWMETCAVLGGNPKNVVVMFCTDAQMRDYQREFRKIDRATDILSFPEREAVSERNFTPQGAWGDLHLGDLIVSLETVSRAAKRVKRPVNEELLEVIIHGCLHLIGMDHIGDSARDRARARRMKSLQRELFRLCRRFI